MLEDTDGTLLNSALQSGRRLVLSSAGKLILNDPKYKPVMTAPRPIPTAAVASVVNQQQHTSPGKRTQFVPAASVSTLNNNHNIHNNGAHSSGVRFETLRKKPTLFMPSKSTTIGGGGVVQSSAMMAGAATTSSMAASNPALPLKTNKVIKILSAEEFKQMCGANAAAGSTLKKISTESFQKGQLKYQTISNSNILTQLTRKKPILNKIKLGTLSQATKVSPDLLQPLC